MRLSVFLILAMAAMFALGAVAATMSPRLQAAVWRFDGTSPPIGGCVDLPDDIMKQLGPLP